MPYGMYRGLSGSVWKPDWRSVRFLSRKSSACCPVYSDGGPSSTDPAGAAAIKRLPDTPQDQRRLREQLQL
jgi:hypothetical protein